MRNMLALVGLLVVAFLSVGWYRGWYSLSRSAGTDGNSNIQLNFQSTKIRDDVQAGLERTEHVIHDIQKNGGAETKSIVDPLAPQTPATLPAPIRTGTTPPPIPVPQSAVDSASSFFRPSIRRQPLPPNEQDLRNFNIPPR